MALYATCLQVHDLIERRNGHRRALVERGVRVVKIAVIGTGYVGLVTATCLAESGNEVVGIDKDAAKIATLESGKLASRAA